MVSLAAKVLLVAVIGGLVAMFIFGRSFWYGFILIGISGLIYGWRNR